METRNIRITKQQLQALAKISKQTGITQSELIRRAIDIMILEYMQAQPTQKDLGFETSKKKILEKRYALYKELAEYDREKS
jgi:hypothetical protein